MNSFKKRDYQELINLRDIANETMANNPKDSDEYIKANLEKNAINA